MDEELFTPENFLTYLLDLYGRKEVEIICNWKEETLITLLLKWDKNVETEYWLYQACEDDDSFEDCSETCLPEETMQVLVSALQKRGSNY